MFELFQGPRAQWGALAGAAALVLAIVVWRTAPALRVSEGPIAPQVAATGSTSKDDAHAMTAYETFAHLETDEAWAIVRSVADELATEDMNAAGVTARPGSAEYMVASLSENERSELAQLLEDAIKRRQPAESSS
jgi:hypothetical protein